jgi:hypothetical protein
VAGDLEKEGYFMRKSALLAVVIAVAMAIPITAFGIHQFTDVPNSHVFHNSIDWMKDNGITEGCNPPANDKYCPDDFTTRGQMAAFFKRLAEKKVVDAATAVNATNADNADTLDGKNSTDFVAVDTALAFTFSCEGTAHVPWQDTTTYSWVGSRLFRTGGPDLFRCNADLPDGALVTSVSWSVHDTTGSAVSCSMWRTNMVASIGAETNMASASSSGTPGGVQITDSSVGSATIDNSNYAYFTQCSLGGTTSAMGLYGVNIAYTDNPNSVIASSGGSGEGSAGVSTD